MKTSAKTNTLKTLTIGLAILVTFGLLSCTPEIDSPTGQLSVQVGEVTGRTIMPDDPLAQITSWQISLTKSGESTRDATISPGGTADFTGLSLGTWTLSATGKNSIDQNIAYGSEAVQIGAGANSFTVDAFFLTSGTGDLELTINWPTSSGVETLSYLWNEQSPSSLSISENAGTSSAVLNLISVDSGIDNTLVLEFRRSGELLAMVDHVVWILDNQSTTETITLDAADFLQAPQAPSSLIVTNLTATSLTLEWTDESSVEEGYRLSRSTDGVTYTILADLPANSSQYNDSGLTEGTTYYYRLVSYNNFGDSTVLSTSATPSGNLTATMIQPLDGASNVDPYSPLKIQLNRSMDPNIQGSLSFGFPEILLKSGVDALETREIESLISFETTTLTNDTIVFSPEFMYAYQEYLSPTLDGFQTVSGDPISNITLANHDFVTDHIPLTSVVEDWRDEVIYFMLTDRFNNGDTANDQLKPGSDSDHVAGDGKTYQGGDYEGLTARMDYLANLGITSIWITAPVKQTWENATYASYHGYWAQDFLSVDPHLGTMKDFRDMVAAAHSRGISVIMDVVVNHTGSVFNYPGQANEWEPTFNAGGTYTIDWLEDSFSWAADANRVRPNFGDIGNEPLENLFTRKGGNATTGSGNEVTQGDFAGLRDINTSNSVAVEALKHIFKWWIANTNVDGYRIDTVKHIDQSFWTDFIPEIKGFASTEGGKNFFTLAEVYDGSASGLGAYTQNNMLDSVLGFQMNGAVFDWNDGDNITSFKDSGSWASRNLTVEFETKLAATNADGNLATVKYTAPNGDSVTAADLIGYFIDNHDLNRFLNGSSDIANAAPTAGEIANLRTALSWLLTWEGIPVLYYATEQNYKQTLALSSGGEHGDGAGNVNKGNRPNLWEVSNSSQGNSPFNESHDTFSLIAGLNALRQTYPALRRGPAAVRWSDNDGTGNDKGIIAFLRKGETVGEDLLVVINAHPSEWQAGTFASGNDMGTDWAPGTTLEVVPIPGYDDDAFGSELSGVNDTAYVDTDGSAAITPASTVTTFTQVGKTSAVYFQVPPNSIRILKVQGYNP